MNPPSEIPLIELGIIMAGPLEPVDRDAIEAALAAIRRRLDEWLPEFTWRLPAIVRDEWIDEPSIEPTELLAQAKEEREAERWDFAIVLTGADLVSHYKPFALAVISRAQDACIISTSRIDPRAEGVTTSTDDRRQRLQERIEHLVLHALGHWAGLGHSEDVQNVMHDIESVDTLRHGVTLDPEQRDIMRSTLSDIADLRLEEREDPRRSSAISFFVRAAWENRGEILDAVVQARPWEFPTRLSRLTTAAVSTVLVLLMTAETWDMAMSQQWTSVTALFVISLVMTTAYVAIRQQLLLRRASRPLSEQIVTTNVAAVATVATGMLVMFAVLCLLVLAAGATLFPRAVVSGWAASVSAPIGARHYFLLAGTVGSLGILIGALGASFEEQTHFRHVIFVDEEV